MDEVVGQSKLFAGPGQDVRLPVAHMVRVVDSPPADAFLVDNLRMFAYARVHVHLLVSRRRAVYILCRRFATRRRPLARSHP